MHALGLSLIAVGVAGLLVLSAQIFWHEMRTLRYVKRLDDWAQEVREWH